MRVLPYIRALLFALVVLVVPAAAFAQISIVVAVAPPELPIYDQPICPGDDYIWTPGYWAYADDDYYWVPGTWVLAPEAGFFWTPPYWGWGGSGFVFYEGYWGPVVGFYGGIDYGFGYFGHGYEGGRWDHDHFFYNRAVNNVDINIVHNVYETRVEDTRSTRVSYNGGRGGISDRPRPEEEAAARQRHVGPVAAQTQHIQAARSNPQLHASANHGRPSVAATPRPGAFSDRGVVSAREGGRVNSAPSRSETGAARSESGAARSNPSHVRDLAPIERPAPSNSGNAKADQKYQQQQEKLYANQQKDRQKLQQQQEKDHQRLEQQKANEATRQQTEQRHQQQTQQMVERHTQQQQHLQQRQPPPASHVAPSKPR